MNSKIIVTNDNSKTLLLPELNETYHSTKGAITESQHVFIKEGLEQINSTEADIFEMGFGTGLNAILTLDYCMKHDKKVNYTTIEAYPLDITKVKEMQYLEQLELNYLSDEFNNMHLSSNTLNIHKNFKFEKIIGKIEETDLPCSKFDLVYYDAFGPKVQPHLWNTAILRQIYQAMKDQSALVTYCAQGQFKRNLKEVGFEVESIPGPPGKREMTRALKHP